MSRIPTDVHVTGGNVEYIYNTASIPASGTANIYLDTTFNIDTTEFSELILAVNATESISLDFKVDLQTFKSTLSGYQKTSTATPIATGAKFFATSSPMRYIGNRLLVIITNNDTTAAHTFGLVAKFKI